MQRAGRVSRNKKGAEVLGTIISLDKDCTIITANKYGKETVIYVGMAARSEVLNCILYELITKLKIKKGPDVPPDGMARQIDNRHILYMNRSGETKEIQLKATAKSLLWKETYKSNFTLVPFEQEVIGIE